MNMVLIALVTLWQAETRAIVVSCANGCQQSFPLPADSAADCFPAFNDAIDYARTHGGGTLQLPEAEIKISQCVDLWSGVVIHGRDPLPIEGQPRESKTIITNLNGSFVGPLITSNNKFRGWGQSEGEQRGCGLRNLTLKNTALNSASNHCCLIRTQRDSSFSNIHCEGTRHEGFVAEGVYCRYAFITATGCGYGSQFRTNTGAGLNISGSKSEIVDCTASDCGQAFEVSGNNLSLIRCRALAGDPSKRYSPNGVHAGFNCGSNNQGACRMQLIDCEAENYLSPLSYGNSNGRAGGLTVKRFKYSAVPNAQTCRISLYGGLFENLVDVGYSQPADEPILLEDITAVYPRAPHMQNALAVQPTKVGADPIRGPISDNGFHSTRSPLVIRRFVVQYTDLYADPSTAQQSAFLIVGKYDAPIAFESCEIRGAGSPGVRGHISINDWSERPWGTARTGHIQAKLCKAFKADGTEYEFLLRRWGSPE